MQEQSAINALLGYKIKASTVAWSRLENRFDVTEQFDSFHQGNIFGEDDDCLQELMKEAKRLKGIRHRPLLMKLFITHGADNESLVKLNTCRMFLRVVFLSEIISFNSEEIVAWA